VPKAATTAEPNEAIMTLRLSAGHRPPAIATSQAGIRERVEEGPFPATATVVGSHGGAIGARLSTNKEVRT
jgi:hypothetical protein